MMGYTKFHCYDCMDLVRVKRRKRSETAGLRKQIRANGRTHRPETTIREHVIYKRRNIGSILPLAQARENNITVFSNHKHGRCTQLPIR